MNFSLWLLSEYQYPFKPTKWGLIIQSINLIIAQLHSYIPKTRFKQWFCNFSKKKRNSWETSLLPGTINGPSVLTSVDLQRNLHFLHLHSSLRLSVSVKPAYEGVLRQSSTGFASTEPAAAAIAAAIPEGATIVPIKPLWAAWLWWSQEAPLSRWRLQCVCKRLHPCLLHQRRIFLCAHHLPVGWLT